MSSGSRPPTVSLVAAGALAAFPLVACSSSPAGAARREALQSIDWPNVDPASRSTDAAADALASRLARHRSPQDAVAGVPVIAPAATPPAPLQDSKPSGAPDTQEPDDEEMASMTKKLNNPISSLISVPLQSNGDWGGGPDGNGFQYKLNVQPVIPVSISDDWNVILRTILPIYYQHDVASSQSSQTGLGDTTFSAFLSPKEDVHPIWGVGPALLLPTATEDELGSRKWGAGPTGVALIQEGPWTAGILANHIWSYAGDDDRPYVSATFIQPFLVHQFPRYFSVGANTESTYDWNGSQWTIPINVFAQQVVKIGDQPMSFQLGGRYYAAAPSGGPEWGLRFAVIFLFPKKD